MAIITRNNILEAVKKFYNEIDIVEGKPNYNLFKQVIDKLKKKYPLLKIKPYNESKTDVRVQVIYGPFHVCTIEPLFSRMIIDNSVKDVIGNKFVDETIAVFSVSLKRRSDECEKYFLEFPSEFREELIDNLINYKKHREDIFAYDYYTNDQFTIKVKNKLEDFKNINYLEVCKGIVENMIVVIINNIHNNKKYNDILEIVKILDNL